jgi:hypothetical protein
MVSKYDLITELYEIAIKSASNSPDAWTAFLRSACRNYKCRFDEQILIYAQRPDATAVLEIEKWNKQFGRWVNKGAKGIAVFSDEPDKTYSIKHYFDISDTHSSRLERPVPLWQMQSEYEDVVIDSLENSFGELSEKDTLADALVSAVENVVDDNYSDYFYALKQNLDDSFLEELDNFNIQVEYLSLLKSSVGYMLLTRCGIDPDDYFEPHDFRNITDFNTKETLNAIGIATGDIAELCLREIAVTVLNLQYRKETQNRTFAYNADKAHNEPITQKSERSAKDGTDISDGGRLHGAEFDDTERNGSDTRQIRTAPGEVSETTQPRPVRESADFREIERAPAGSGAISGTDDGITDSGTGGGLGSERRIESSRPNEMGRADEQYPQQRRGDDTERHDIRVKPLPTQEQQLISLGEVKETKPIPSLLSFGEVPLEVVDEQLAPDSSDNIFNKKFRVYYNYQKINSDYELAQFLKNDFGIGGRPSFVDESFRVSYNAQGITFSKGDTLNPTIKHILSTARHG